MPYPTHSRGYQAPFNFDPYGDEDEEDPLSSDRPMSQRLQALLPQHDEELNARWRDAENKALDDATPETYGVAEGVRDFAPMAIGAGLDILINKGKGLGALTGAGMQALSSESKRRDTARAQAAKEALLIKQQREAGGDRMTNAMHALLRGDELGQQIAASKAKLGSEEEQAEARAGERAKTAAETRNITAEAVEREQFPGARVYLEAMRTATGQQRADIEADYRRKKLEFDQKKLDADIEANKNKAAELKNAAEEKAANKRREEKTRNVNKFNAAAKDAMQLGVAIQQLQPTMMKYNKKNLPLVGRLEGHLPTDVAGYLGYDENDSIAIDQARAAAHSFFSHDVTGAHSGLAETERNQLANGLRPGGSEAEFRQGLNRARDALRRRLRQLASADPEAANEAIEAAGLTDFVYGPDMDFGYGMKQPERLQPPAAPSATPPAPAAAPAAAPQAAPAQPEPEAPKGTPQQRERMRNLMMMIPKGEREAVLGGIAPLPIEDRIRLLEDKLGVSPEDEVAAPKAPDDKLNRFKERMKKRRGVKPVE